MSEQEEAAAPTVLGSDRSAVVGQRRRRGVRVTSAAVVALGLALSGGAVAGAVSSSTGSAGSSTTAPTSGTLPNRPPMGGSPPVAMGTVKSTGDGTFTITAQDGTLVTVNVSSATTYIDAGVTSPTLANVTVGARVAVFGTDAANVVTATSVGIGGPPSGGRGGPGGAGGSPASPPSAVGTVKSIGDDTFTVAAADGSTVTVNVSSTTAYFDAGVTSPTVANVTVGEHVAVFGTDTANVVTATNVGIGDPPSGGSRGPGGRPGASASSSS